LLELKEEEKILNNLSQKSEAGDFVNVKKIKKEIEKTIKKQYLLNMFTMFCIDITGGK
jgi:hypothetical protein